MTLDAHRDQPAPAGGLFGLRLQRYGRWDTRFPVREGTFTACSFWNVECLALAGDLKLARFHFERTLSYAKHLGLYSEEVGLNGEMLGNFPQAFTHLGLISAASFLDRKLDEAK